MQDSKVRADSQEIGTYNVSIGSKSRVVGWWWRGDDKDGSEWSQEDKIRRELLKPSWFYLFGIIVRESK